MWRSYDSVGKEKVSIIPPDFTYGEELGYTTRTDDPTYTTGTDLLNITITGDGINPVYVEGYCRAASGTTTVIGYIRDGAGGTGTIHASAFNGVSTTGSGYQQMILIGRIAPFTGTKTLYMRLSTDSGTGTVYCNTTYSPMYLKATKIKQVAQYANPSVSVYKSADQTLTNATETLITFNSESYDTDNMHDVSTNTGRLVAPITGIYTVISRVSWPANSTGFRYFYVRKNAAGAVGGGTFIGYETQEIGNASVSSHHTFSKDLKLNAGDYVELFAYQNAGGDLVISGGEGYTTFSLRYSGPVANTLTMGSILWTSLPTSPTDGQEILFQSSGMATDGIVWKFRYNAASASAYKWEFTGGSAWMDTIDTEEARTSATYGDLATAGPSRTTPLAGDWHIEHGAYMYAVAASAEAHMSYAVGGTAAVDGDRVLVIEPNAAATGYASVSRRTKKTAVATSSAIATKYRGDGTTGAGFGNRWIAITPIRVG